MKGIDNRKEIRRATLLFFSFISLFIGTKALFLFGQNEASISQWQENISHYNSASIGSSPLLDLTVLYRQQWIGIEGAPSHIYLLANAPLSSGKFYHGIGIDAYGEKKGLYKTISLKAQYAFKIKIKKGVLSTGIEMGLINSSFDGTKLFIPEGNGLNPTDPALPSTLVSGRTFDIGSGIFFQHPAFYLGLSAKHLLAPKLQLGTNHYIRIPRSYNLLAGYNFTPTNSLLSWYPSLLAVTDFRAYRIDIGLTLGIAKSYFAGIIYRPNNAIGLQLKAIWGKFKLGYAFEMPTSILARGNFGTHELLLSYALPIAPKKEKGLKKKSIRLL